jgi:hypothetical protein
MKKLGKILVEQKVYAKFLTKESKPSAFTVLLIYWSLKILGRGAVNPVSRTVFHSLQDLTESGIKNCGTCM